MMMGNRKEVGRVCTVLLHVIDKIQTAIENRLTAILNQKTRSISRFDPGLLGHNSVALLLLTPQMSLSSESNSLWTHITESSERRIRL